MPSLRKSDGATFILDDLFCKSSKLSFHRNCMQTVVPDYDPRTLGSGPTKPKQKRHLLTTLLSTFSGTFNLLSLRCSEPSLPRLSVIALIVTAEFAPSWTTPGTRPLVLLSWKMQFLNCCQRAAFLTWLTGTTDDGFGEHWLVKQFPMVAQS